MAYQEFGYTNSTGEDLFACSWEVEGRALANVVLIHGLGEHIGRYKKTGEFLSQQGLNVYAFDLLGFGRSAGKRGHVSSFEVYFRDIHRFIQIIKEPWQQQKTFILGHSMGGLLGLAYGIKFPGDVDGYIISSPALKSYPIPISLKWTLQVFNYLLPRIAIKNKLAVDMLSHDQQVVDLYIKDSLVHDYVTPRFVSELMKLIQFTQANASNFLDPLLLLYAGADKIVDPEGVREFVPYLKEEVVKEVICYDSLYHEILNEKEGGQILHRIEQWIRGMINS